MKILKLLASLMLLSIPLLFAGGKPETPPGVDKKTLEILDLAVVTTATTATISWRTNFPAFGSVDFLDSPQADVKSGVHHSFTFTALSSGPEYEFVIRSFSERYGDATPVEVTVTL